MNHGGLSDVEVAALLAAVAALRREAARLEADSPVRRSLLAIGSNLSRAVGEGRPRPRRRRRAPRARLTCRG